MKTTNYPLLSKPLHKMLRMPALPIAPKSESFSDAVEGRLRLSYGTKEQPVVRRKKSENLGELTTGIRPPANEVTKLVRTTKAGCDLAGIAGNQTIREFDDSNRLSSDTTLNRDIASQYVLQLNHPHRAKSSALMLEHYRDAYLASLRDSGLCPNCDRPLHVESAMIISAKPTKRQKRQLVSVAKGIAPKSIELAIQSKLAYKASKLWASYSVETHFDTDTNELVIGEIVKEPRKIRRIPTYPHNANRHYRVRNWKGKFSKDAETGKRVTAVAPERLEYKLTASNLYDRIEITNIRYADILSHYAVFQNADNSYSFGLVYGGLLPVVSSYQMLRYAKRDANGNEVIDNFGNVVTRMFKSNILNYFDAISREHLKDFALPKSYRLIDDNLEACIC